MLTAYLVAQLIPWLLIAALVIAFSVQERAWTLPGVAWASAAIANVAWTAWLLVAHLYR